MRSSASSLVTKVAVFTFAFDSNRMRTWSICFSVAGLGHVDSVQKKALTTSFSFVWSLHERAHVPKAISRPTRNIPIRTVTVAAIVVDRLAVKIGRAHV